MTSKREQFYKQRIAELEAQLKLRDERVSTLQKQVAELLKANEALVKKNDELAEQIAKLSRNSSNSSKPPSSDIVKAPKPKQSDGPRRQGGQLGHKGVNRQPFRQDQIDKTIPLYADMFRFLFDSAVPPTNNAAEQTLRQAIIDRRITQGSRSLMGRQWNARIWTVLATCRKQGRSSQSAIPSKRVERLLFSNSYSVAATSDQLMA